LLKKRRHKKKQSGAFLFGLTAVLYQVLNKQVLVPVPVQVQCINYRHSVTLQLHKVKVVVSFIFKKRTVS